MKKDFYVYKCLREIHGINQAALPGKNRLGILLMFNTPGSLEHLTIHTDPDKLQSVINTLLNHVLRYNDSGCVEFGYKLGIEDQLSFYVKEPPRSGSDQFKSENEFDAEADLLSEIMGMLSELGGSFWIDSKHQTGKHF